MQRAVYEQRYELGFLGAPYHTYLLEDLANLPVNQYKMVLFLNTTHLTADQLTLIQRRFCQDQRFIVWSGLAQVPETAGPTGFAGSRRAPVESRGCSLRVAPRIYQLDNADENSSLKLLQDGDCAQILSTLPYLPAERLREIAILAGVHIYCHSGEVIYASREFIAIHAATAGVKRIYLPEPGDADWVIGQGKAIRDVPYFDVTLEQGATAMWRICPAAAQA